MAPLRLALLICDSPVPAVVEELGTYLEIYTRWLHKSFKAASDSSVDPESKFVVDGYDVVKAMKYPGLDKYDGLVLTGSSASAYDPIPWITTLVEFMSDTVKTHPQLPIVALCLGHQIMARALGGQCVPNNGNWELGVYELELSEVGREFFGAESINIQQVHRDHVPSLPPFPNIKLLGSTPLTPVQGFIVPRSSESPTSSTPTYPPSSNASPSSTHIFTLQGHPEFTETIVKYIVDARGPKGSGVVDAPTAGEALERAARPHDGLGIIGKKALEVLGVL